MKNVFIVILCFLSMAVFASENKDPNQTLFQSAECFGKQGYCEFVDFRGNSSEPAFEEMPAIIDFYTGPIGTNGIVCEVSSAVCKNGNSEVMGLNPNFKDEEGNSFKGQSTASSQAAQQPVQQAAEPPYRLSTIDGIDSINPMDRAVKLVVTSIVSGLIVEEVVINEGSCLGYSRKKDQWRTTVPVLPMGKDIKIPMPGCTPIKVVVNTNMGSWTHTF